MSDKMVSVDTLRSYIIKNTVAPQRVTLDGMTFEVKSRLSINEMFGFVDVVTNICFGKNGEYMPELYDFAIRCGLYQIYANFDLPSDPSEKYDFVYNASITDEILGQIDSIQFKEIVRAIDKKIEQRASAEISAVIMRMNELDSAFNKMIEKFSTAFDGVDSDAMNKLVNAMNDGKFNITEILANTANKQ